MNIIKISFVLALCLALAFAAKSSNGDTWVLIVAGSNHYYNYRHQSDVYNAYDLLVNRRGMDASKIIVMQYDDIAHSSSNPKPGTVINYPGGPDVYGPNEKNLKDYTGRDVTAKNLLKILAGEDMTGIGSGRTIKSGPNDKIMFLFFDHGAPGLVAMPSGPYLYAKDLISTVKSMKSQGKYSEMLMLIEACESGSMGINMPAELNVLVVTASNPSQSSWACDYDNTYRAYLNDCWSNFWMEQSDLHKYNSTYTLKQFTDDVNAVSKKSPQCIYGDTSKLSEYLSVFQGLGSQKAGLMGMAAPRPQGKVGVSSKNVYEQHLLNQLASNSKAERTEIKRKLAKYYKEANKSDVIYSAAAQQLNVPLTSGDSDPSCYRRSLNLDCVKTATEAHNKACGQYSEYSLKYAHVIANACDVHPAEKVAQTFTNICSAF